MSSLYAFSDPLTQNKRFFYGYLNDCQVKTPYSCPYAMMINSTYLLQPSSGP